MRRDRGRKKKDIKNATCWLSGWGWQGECVSGSCERLSRGIWVNMLPSPRTSSQGPWNGNPLDYTHVSDSSKCFPRAHWFPVPPAWLISRTHSSISFGPPKRLLKMKGTECFRECVCVCARRQLPVYHCLDRVMCLHTERGGDMPKSCLCW